VIVGKTKGLGRQGWMFEETLNAPKKFGVEDKVIFTGFVPSEDLPYLLNGARAYCLPSLFEGFGIPALEAMATATPVVASNVSSLPEVVGNAGLLINPNSVESIAEAIKKISSDNDLREKLSKKSLEQSKKFSWEKMAGEVLEVLEKVGEN
jgi:glycosyltransferase involved in cell wall biosynthesis